MASNQKENKMSRKITAKELLREVRAIKKLAAGTSIPSVFPSITRQLNIPEGVQFLPDGSGEFEIITENGEHIYAVLGDSGYEISGKGAKKPFIKADITFDEEGEGVTNDPKSIVSAIQTMLNWYDNALLTSIKDDELEMRKLFSMAFKGSRTFDYDSWYKKGKIYIITGKSYGMPQQVVGGGGIEFQIYREGDNKASVNALYPDKRRHMGTYIVNNVQWTANGVPLIDPREFKKIFSKVSAKTKKW